MGEHPLDDVDMLQYIYIHTHWAEMDTTWLWNACIRQFSSSYKNTEILPNDRIAEWYLSKFPIRHHFVSPRWERNLVLMHQYAWRLEGEIGYWYKQRERTCVQASECIEKVHVAIFSSWSACVRLLNEGKSCLIRCESIFRGMLRSLVKVFPTY